LDKIIKDVYYEEDIFDDYDSDEHDDW